MSATTLRFIDPNSPFPESAKRLLDALYEINLKDGNTSLTESDKIAILEEKLGGHYGFDACGGELNDALKRIQLEEEYLASEGAISLLTV